MKDTFNEALIQQYGHPNVLITDPPRAGMHPDVISQLLDLKAPKIIYVSCDSSTLARDLALLSEAYRVDAIQPSRYVPANLSYRNSCRFNLKIITVS